MSAQNLTESKNHLSSNWACQCVSQRFVTTCCRWPRGDLLQCLASFIKLHMDMHTRISMQCFRQHLLHFGRLGADTSSTVVSCWIGAPVAINGSCPDLCLGWCSCGMYCFNTLWMRHLCPVSCEPSPNVLCIYANAILHVGGSVSTLAQLQCSKLVATSSGGTLRTDGLLTCFLLLLCVALLFLYCAFVYGVCRNKSQRWQEVFARAIDDVDGEFP